jgi:hypothetical protein
MSRQGHAPQEGTRLHSAAAAFEVRHADVEDFARRCGRRARVDKRPCMHPFGHDGPHAWEPPGA